MHPQPTIGDHLRALGLPANATRAEVVAAYRVLASQYHPERDNSRDGNQRFAAVVEAYRALQRALRLQPDAAAAGLCPRCTRSDELLAGPDGRRACPECLLADVQRTRRLRCNVVDHLRTLELSPGATADQVRAAFRRLALQHHPDLDRSRAGIQRFVDIVESYRVLQMEMGLRADAAHYRRCPRCMRYAELLKGLDGRLGCPDCFLGETRRRRCLPMPELVTVCHVATIALYALSLIFATAFMGAHAPGLAVLSLVCAGLGVLLIFIDCLTVPTVR